MQSRQASKPTGTEAHQKWPHPRQAKPLALRTQSTPLSAVPEAQSSALMARLQAPREKQPAVQGKADHNERRAARNAQTWQAIRATLVKRKGKAGEFVLAIIDRALADQEPADRAAEDAPAAETMRASVHIHDLKLRFPACMENSHHLRRHCSAAPALPSRPPEAKCTTAACAGKGR